MEKKVEIFYYIMRMVKLEEDEDFDDFDDFKEEKPAPQQIFDYKSRRILVWVEEEDIFQTVEETLSFLLPLATIRMANSEKRAVELSEKEEWDTFVVDLTEPNVSTSDFIKAANNNPDVMLVALDYTRLSRDNDQNEIFFDPIRKLFDIETVVAKPEEPLN